MRNLLVVLSLCFVGVILWGVTPCSGLHSKEPKQTWGYVEVRPGAHMFWWLYYTTSVPDYKKAPLVLWLQGGPGASSTGFGNFEEIGPLDHDLQNRTHSWVDHVNVLFVDNPVGVGFSYVNDTKLLVTNNTQIATDLVTMFTRFLDKVPEFQEIPLYIFSESYGGKMAAQFALKLWKRIQSGKLKCNLKSVSLGDSWISPVDSVLTWAPFLFSTSLVDNAGFAVVNKSAYGVQEALEKGQFKKATELWDKTEDIVRGVTNGVNFYNILQPNTEESSGSLKVEESHPNSLDEENGKIPTVRKILNQIFAFGRSSSEDDEKSNEIRRVPKKPKSKLASKHLKHYHSDPLTTLMNGKIKKMLRIIPDNVTWGGQSSFVFDALEEDFMRPVVRVVENLLNNTGVGVNVYSGQLDLIVDTMGTLQWVEGMKGWSGTEGWMKSTRKPVEINNLTEMFVKSYKNFAFYWILKAGHMVPADAPETAVTMLQSIINSKK